MRLRCRRFRRFRHNPAGPRIYSGEQAKRRAAGTPPGWVEMQARWIRAKTEGDGEALALVVAAVLVVLIAVLGWFALGR